MGTSGDRERVRGAGSEQANSAEGQAHYKGGVDVKSKDITPPPKEDQKDESTGGRPRGSE